MNQAYECREAKRARRLLEALAARLESEHPGAAASLREGLEETLTVIEPELPERLQLSLRTTNPIENLVGSLRRVSRRVKRWRGGQMTLRWCGAAVLEAEQHFRRIRGYREMPKLIAALRARDAALNEKENAAQEVNCRRSVSNKRGDITRCAACGSATTPGSGKEEKDIAK